MAGFIAVRVTAGEPGPAAPTVAVAVVGRQDLFKELTVQAEFRPYQEVELHAKVSGYLQKINVDFGDRVKEGDVVATIEVPELKDELDQAIATEQRAEADQHNAHLDYKRLADVNKSQPNLVAQQDIDNAEAKDLAATAAVTAAKAEVGKYRTLLSYTRITAPFSGVVTARYADPGALIQTGSSSQTQLQTLIRLSENQRLRLDFPISVTYAQSIAIGDVVEVKLEGSDRSFELPITRFSRRISMDTRTMETEVEVPNDDLKLIPGMYATVTLKFEKHPGALALPVEAVSGSSNPTVYVVAPDGKVEARSVKLGIESPSYYEALSGVAAGDRVVIGSRAAIHPGQMVLAKIVQSTESR